MLHGAYHALIPLLGMTAAALRSATVDELFDRVEEMPARGRGVAWRLVAKVGRLR